MRYNLGAFLGVLGTLVANAYAGDPTTSLRSFEGTEFSGKTQLVYQDDTFHVLMRKFRAAEDVMFMRHAVELRDFDKAWFGKDAVEQLKARQAMNRRHDAEWDDQRRVEATELCRTLGGAFCANFRVVKASSQATIRDRAPAATLMP